MSKEKREFMRFVSETEDESVIEIYGNIGGFDWENGKKINTIESIAKELNRLKASKSKQILVKLNSYGGSSNDAFAIYDALADHPAKIITQCNGYNASASTIIFMAGDERRISKNSLFLIHKCWDWVCGNENVLEEELKTQRTVNETLLNLYEVKVKKNREDIATLMNENNGTGKWITAQEALDYGFATEIYNDTTSAKAAFSGRDFSAFRFPPLPEGYNFDAEEKEPAWMERLVQKFTDIFKPTGPITNQIKPEMKKLSAVFPLLFALVAFKTDSDYDPEKGHAMTDEELKALETKIAEFNAEKTKFDSDKKELEDKLTAMTTSRDELQAKINEVPNPQSVPNPTGNDKTNKSDFQIYMENDPFYKSIETKNLYS